MLFPIGIDRNGLPVEIYTEKKYNVSIKTTPREKFLELCKIALDDLEQEMIQTFKLMGLSGNYDQKYRTDDVTYRALTQVDIPPAVEGRPRVRRNKAQQLLRGLRDHDRGCGNHLQ